MGKLEIVLLLFILRLRRWGRKFSALPLLRWWLRRGRPRWRQRESSSSFRRRSYTWDRINLGDSLVSDCECHLDDSAHVGEERLGGAEGEEEEAIILNSN